MRADPIGPAPAVSLVVATARLGGMDVLWEGFRQQTLPGSAELILVDYWWEERNAIYNPPFNTVYVLASVLGDRFIHVPPRGGRWKPTSDAHQAWNTGLALARGKVVCCLSDYWFMHPRYLEEHYEVWKRSGGTAMLSGEHYVCALPPLTLSAIARRLMWSTFAEPFHPAMLDSLPVKWRGGKPLAPPRPDGLHPVPWTHYWAACNESAPLEALYAINGYDEFFDGGRNYGDVDLAARLEKVGVEPVRLLNGGLNVRLDPHELPSWATYGGLKRDLKKVPHDERHNAERAHSSKQGKHHYRAENGGFNIADPITVEGVIASYEHHRGDSC